MGSNYPHRSPSQETPEEFSLPFGMQKQESVRTFSGDAQGQRPMQTGNSPEPMAPAAPVNAGNAPAPMAPAEPSPDCGTNRETDSNPIWDKTIGLLILIGIVFGTIFLFMFLEAIFT